MSNVTYLPSRTPSEPLWGEPVRILAAVREPLLKPEDAALALNCTVDDLEVRWQAGDVERYTIAGLKRYELVVGDAPKLSRKVHHRFRRARAGSAGRGQDEHDIRCGTCKESKPPDAFAIRSNATGERATMCRACKTAYNKVWYQANKAVHNEHVKANNRRYRAKAREARALLPPAPPKPKKPKVVRTYQDRRDYFRPYNREWVARRRAEFFADKCCMDCGTTERLELHHRDPALKARSSDHVVWTWSAERREAEIAKCDVVCNACHLRRHGKVPGGKHGGSHRYDRGCRCELCVAGARERARLRRLRRRLGANPNRSGGPA